MKNTSDKRSNAKVYMQATNYTQTNYTRLLVTNIKLLARGCRMRHRNGAAEEHMSGDLKCNKEGRGKDMTPRG